MKTLVATFLICLAQTSLCSRACKRAIQVCNITEVSTENWNLVDYNDCTQICCGGSLVDRDVDLKCCGTLDEGEIYNTDIQICCAWRGAAESSHAVFNKTSQDGFCCGAQLFTQEMYQDRGCCNSWLKKPVVFFHRTEMCCNGNVRFAGDTAFASCCGEFPYDRRVASCPCHNGIVGRNIPANKAGCCYGTGNIQNPYNVDSQDCCNGKPYSKNSQFCCGGLVGRTATQLCCSGSLVSLQPSDQNQENIGCCQVIRGINVAFNKSTEVCCGGTVQDRPGNNPNCCGGTVYDGAVDGENCCNGSPFFNSTSVCCNGIIGAGDSCCGSQAFDSANQICCGGRISARSSAHISCCLNQTFDTSIQTCCGRTVFNNPLIPAGVDGQSTISKTTRCCGDFSDDRTLRPYDYTRSACCKGKIFDYVGVDKSSSKCCGDALIDEASICCDNTAALRLYGSQTACCDGAAINVSSTICCDGTANNRSQNVECCGAATIDTTMLKCCNGKPVLLNGVPPEQAVCCGDACIDGTLYFCCNGKQYRKGATVVTDPAGLTCNDLFAS